MKNASIECPISKVALLLSDTWTMLIIHFLIEDPKRFCELERALDGISTRTLTLKLQKLTEKELVYKNESGLYALTERGKGIKLIENAMRKYEEKYL